MFPNNRTRQPWRISRTAEYGRPAKLSSASADREYTACRSYAVEGLESLMRTAIWPPLSLEYQGSGHENIVTQQPSASLLSTRSHQRQPSVADSGEQAQTCWTSTCELSFSRHSVMMD